MRKRGMLLMISAILGMVLTGCSGGSQPTAATTAAPAQETAAAPAQETTVATAEETAAEPVTLKFASISSQGDLAYDVTQEIIDEIESKSNGSIKIDYYPDSQLGDWQEVFDNIMLGTVDISYGSIADNIDPRVACGYLMGLAGDYGTMEKLFEKGGWLRNEIETIYADKMNVKYLAPAFCGFNGIGMVKELQNPTDPTKQKGAKVRCSTQTVISLGLSNLGYTTVAMNYGEVFTSLQSGLIDGWLGGTATINYNKMRDAINYYYDLKIQAEMNMWTMSMKAWEKLSPEQQDIVQTAFQNGEHRMYELCEQYEDEYLGKLEEAGIQVFSYSAEELRANNEMSRNKTWPEMEEVYGKEFLDKLKEELAKIEG